MSAQTTSLTPKKPAKKGRKPKESCPSDFCRICACSLAIRLPNGGKTSFISTENLFVEPKREGVTRIKLADVLLDLGITIIEDDLCSSRVCASCAFFAKRSQSRQLGVFFPKSTSVCSSFLACPPEINNNIKVDRACHDWNINKSYLQDETVRGLYK